jgi:hypothetical protein
MKGHETFCLDFVPIKDFSLTPPGDLRREDL